MIEYAALYDVSIPVGVESATWPGGRGRRPHTDKEHR